MDGSRRCDIFILITDESGAGMYTELGAALTSKRTKIYVIGNYLDRSVFFFHPKVKRFETINEVLEDLDK